MSVYLVADIAVSDPESYQEYIKLVPAFIKKHHGRYLIRSSEAEVIEGQWKPGRLIMLEFPNRELAQAFIEDPEYQRIASIRKEAARTNLVMVEGYVEKSLPGT